MQQGEGKEQERKTGQRGKVYIRDTETVKEKNVERVSLLLSIEQKLCSEWNTSLYVGLYRILHSIQYCLKKK